MTSETETETKTKTKTEIITPLCIAHERGREAFANIMSIFETPAAGRLGLRGIAQPYRISHGMALQDGAPSLFLHDGSEEITLNPADGPLSDKGMQSDREEIAKLTATIKCGPLGPDMLHTSSDRTWLLIFPQLFIMQGENIAKELKAITKYNTWKRATYATISTIPPLSNHDALIAYDAIQEAIRILHQFRAKAIAEAVAAGFILGDLTYNSLMAGSQTWTTTHTKTASLQSAPPKL